MGAAAAVGVDAPEPQRMVQGASVQRAPAPSSRSGRILALLDEGRYRKALRELAAYETELASSYPTAVPTADRVHLDDLGLSFRLPYPDYPDGKAVTLSEADRAPLPSPVGAKVPLLYVGPGPIDIFFVLAIDARQLLGIEPSATASPPSGEALLAAFDNSVRQLGGSITDHETIEVQGRPALRTTILGPGGTWAAQIAVVVRDGTLLQLWLISGPDERARRLVDRGPGPGNVRRIVSREEVARDWEDLVVPLADARLLTTSETVKEQSTVEIVHEALLRAWPRLQEWIADHEAFDRWRQWHQQPRGFLCGAGALRRGRTCCPRSETPAPGHRHPRWHRPGPGRYRMPT